jgi:hypothetical protein
VFFFSGGIWERRLQTSSRLCSSGDFALELLQCQAAVHGEWSMTPAAFRFQFGLRRLFLMMTIAGVGIWTGRIVCLHRQAKFHHHQVESHVRESERMFLTGRPFSPKRWDNIRRQLKLACAYDHAFCHPWLTLAEAHTQVEEQRSVKPSP